VAFYQLRLGSEGVFDWGIRGKPGASELKRIPKAMSRNQMMVLRSFIVVIKYMISAKDNS